MRMCQASARNNTADLNISDTYHHTVSAHTYLAGGGFPFSVRSLEGSISVSKEGLFLSSTSTCTGTCIHTCLLYCTILLVATQVSNLLSDCMIILFHCPLIVHCSPFILLEVITAAEFLLLHTFSSKMSQLTVCLNQSLNRALLRIK